MDGWMDGCGKSISHKFMHLSIIVKYYGCAE
jgi:hypothetical protein